MPDPFSIPFTDEILDQVVGHKMYLFVDGYCGYNQISIVSKDQSKMAFITDWDAYATRVVPFGLRNAPSTFQRFMVVTFWEFLIEFIAIYLDIFCVYSFEKNHLQYLEKVFANARKPQDH